MTIQASQVGGGPESFGYCGRRHSGRRRLRADGAFQGISGQAAIGLHVANLGLDGASPAKVDDLFGSQPYTCAADQDTDLRFVMAPVNRDQ